MSEAPPPSTVAAARSAAQPLSRVAAWGLVAVVGAAAAAVAAAWAWRPQPAKDLVWAQEAGRDDAQQALQAELDQPATPRPLLLAAGSGPEGRLIAAYQAVAEGRHAAAYDLVTALVHEQPGFTLAQLLRADLLATRAGTPKFLGLPVKGASPPDEALAPLREEAFRRLAALIERPPEGALPREFAHLAPSVTRAVAVDASRSRLYLFKNGPQGLTLERDFYVSLGKGGINKRVEGDFRTPLGVYWITSSLTANQIDNRFGSAALGINYPNAWDRIQGRTGTGLFVHGVPFDTLARPPWTTDGCVALANEDVQFLLDRLTTVDTPVLIAKELEWVAPAVARQDAVAFQQAYAAWDLARRQGDDAAQRSWYLTGANVEAQALRGTAPRDELSFIGWYGDGAPMMVVSGHQGADAASRSAPAVVRQYWVQREGQWRIMFEGRVAGAGTAVAKAAAMSRVARVQPAAASLAVAPAEPQNLATASTGYGREDLRFSNLAGSRRAARSEPTGDLQNR